MGFELQTSKFRKHKSTNVPKLGRYARDLVLNPLMYERAFQFKIFSHGPDI